MAERNRKLSGTRPLVRGPRGAPARQVPRGVPLVEAVMSAIERAGGTMRVGAQAVKPRPVPPEVLAGVTLAGGLALPLSMQRWLMFDGAWLGVRVPGALRALSLSALAEQEFPGYGEYCKGVEARVLPGACYLLPTRAACSSDVRCFMYVGTPDTAGEYPVLALDSGDSGTVGVAACGFDVHLALTFGLFEASACYGAAPSGYEKPTDDTARRWLNKQKVLDILPYAPDEFR